MNLVHYTLSIYLNTSITKLYLKIIEEINMESSQTYYKEEQAISNILDVQLKLRRIALTLRMWLIPAISELIYVEILFIIMYKYIMAQIAPLSFQAAIPHTPRQVRWVRCTLQWSLSGHQHVCKSDSQEAITEAFKENLKWKTFTT